MRCSEKSEVWAFGVTMWEILTEKEPFTGLSPVDACRQVLYKNIRLPLSSIENVELRKILASCWESNAQSRPTMEEIGIRLEEIKKEERIKRNSKNSYGCRFLD